MNGENEMSYAAGQVMKPKLKSFPTAERLITMFLPINPIKENRTIIVTI
jgi:hypothetical protein